MKTALRASDPVMFLEPKSLLSTKGPVPVGEYYIPFGQAKVVRQGTDLTIVSCGALVRRSVEAAEQLAAEGISCEVIDLRTIVPLDVDTIVASVAKTGRLLVVDEAYAMCGIGAELAAVIMEHAFDELDAPVGRLHTDPVSQPFAPALENAILGHRREDRRRGPFRHGGPAAHPAACRGPVAQVGRAAVGCWRWPGGRRGAPRPLPQRRRRRNRPPRRSPDGVPVTVPNMDLIITEATVVAWLKKIGDPVRQGEAVVELETDKAVTQVESPADGVLAEILAGEGAVVPLGGRLGTIRP